MCAEAPISKARQSAYELAKKAGNAELLENHHNFWGDEAAMTEGNPPRMLERGEKVFLPPVLVFGGDKDE